MASTSGATALSLSKNRNAVPTVGVSGNEATLRRMALYWGVIPLAGAPVDDSRALVAYVIEWGKREGCLGSGDRIVLVAGTGLAHSAHNMLVVHGDPVKSRPAAESRPEEPHAEDAELRASCPG